MKYNIIPMVEGDDDIINDKIVEYNLSRFPATQEEPFEVFGRKITDEEGNMIAGIFAIMYCWKVMAVDIIWVDERYRKQGLGNMLLKDIERIAMENDCTLIHLDTFDFQAKGFYEKNGYTVFGVLEDCPKGHVRYFMKKTL